MKYSIKLISLLVFTMQINLLAQPYELMSMNGPNGGIIGDIAISSNGTIFAGVYSLWVGYYGLYKSEDNGDSWTQVEIQDDKIEVYSIYINTNDDIYVGTNFGGRIWKSINDGETWENIREGYDTGECWAFGESLDGILFAGDGQYHKTFRSLDYGNHWEYVADLAPTVFATDTNNNIYAGSLYYGLFGSQDLGQTWHQNDFLKDVPVTTMLIDSLNHFYCGTGYYDNGNGVYYSENEGASWGHLGLDSNVILSLAFDSGHNIYAGSLEDGLFKTSDNGINWSQHTNGLFQKQVFRMKINNQDDIFIGSEDEGIFRSTDGGDNFEQIGLPISKVENFVIAPNGSFYFATPSGVQVYNPQSEKWKNLGLHAVEAVDINMATEELYTATFADGVYRSTDYGNTWIETSINTASLTSVYNIKVLKDSSLLVATQYELRRSIDNGESWINLPIATDFFRHSIYIQNNGCIYVNGRQDDEHSIFVSIDNGSSFSKIIALPNELDWPYLNSIVVNSSSDIFISSYSSNSGIYRKLNSENELEKIYDVPSASLYIDENNFIYAGSKEKVYISQDNGNSWQVFISNELEYNYVNFMLKDNSGYMYLGTAGGTHGLLRTSVPVSVDNENKNIVTKFSLEQNYPNPFNPNTMINFAIPQKGFVQLKVYDILGKEVAVLVNEEKNIGNYEINFDASYLSSGVYFYKMQVGYFAETRKMVLLR